MARPLGGRGKKAPYATAMVRVPVPIKSDVEKLIAQYRTELLGGGSEDETESDKSDDSEEILTAIKLVDRFVEKIGQTEHLHSKTRRDNRNLAKFRNWLASQLSE